MFLMLWLVISIVTGALAALGVIMRVVKFLPS